MRRGIRSKPSSTHPSTASFFLECQIARVRCTGGVMWRMIGSARSQQHAPQMEWKRRKVRGSRAGGNVGGWRWHTPLPPTCNVPTGCDHHQCCDRAHGPARPPSLPPPATPIDITAGRHGLSPIGNAACQIACKHPIPGHPTRQHADALGDSDMRSANDRPSTKSCRSGRWWRA